MGDVPGGHGEVAAGPQIPTPELLSEVGELLRENAGGGPFEPLDHRADALMGTAGEQQVDMVPCDLPRDDLEFPLHRNLADEVADAEGDRPHKHWFPVLRDPDQMDFAVKSGVWADPVFSHATTLPHPSLRLKARGFDHPGKEHQPVFANASPEMRRIVRMWCSAGRRPLQTGPAVVTRRRVSALQWPSHCRAPYWPALRTVMTIARPLASP